MSGVVKFITCGIKITFYSQLWQQISPTLDYHSIQSSVTQLTTVFLIIIRLYDKLQRQESKFNFSYLIPNQSKMMIFEQVRVHEYWFLLDLTFNISRKLNYDGMKFLKKFKFRQLIYRMERKYGITPIRSCTPQEILMIEVKYQQIKPTIEESRQESIYWVNLYSQNKFHIENEQKRQQCYEFVKKLIKEIENGKEQHINCYCFINNPKNGTKHQSFHMDIHESQTTVFIPLVHLIHQNSAQFFAEKPPCEPYINQRNICQRFASSQLHLLERSGRDFLIINQVISKPFVILKMEPGTCHRGIKNASNEDRPVFCINYSPEVLQSYNDPHVDSYY